MKNPLHDGLIAPKEITGHSDKSDAVYIACSAYLRHGEYHTGNLLVIKYDHLIASANAFNFGADRYTDWAVYLTKQAEKMFGKPVRTRLAIPDMVLEYPAEFDFQDVLAILQ